jgi:chromosomal replication initiator protein
MHDAFQAEAESGAPTLERITQRVSQLFRVKPRQVRGLDRTPQLLWPRQLCMYLARQLTSLSLGQIGEYYDRDQSTVRHACQKVTQELARDAELPGLLRQLQSAIA